MLNKNKVKNFLQKKMLILFIFFSIIISCFISCGYCQTVFAITPAHYALIVTNTNLMIQQQTENNNDIIDYKKITTPQKIIPEIYGLINEEGYSKEDALVQGYNHISYCFVSTIKADIEQYLLDNYNNISNEDKQEISYWLAKNSAEELKTQYQKQNKLINDIYGVSVIYPYLLTVEEEQALTDQKNKLAQLNKYNKSNSIITLDPKDNSLNDIETNICTNLSITATNYSYLADLYFDYSTLENIYHHCYDAIVQLCIAKSLIVVGIIFISALGILYLFPNNKFD